MKKETGTQTVEIAFECQFEGGQLTIVRIRTGARPWRFQVELNEGATFDLLDPEDQADLAPTSKTRLVDTFEEAIDLINRYPWRCFSPGTIHEEYRDAVWQAFCSRTGPHTTSPGEERNRDRWRTACGVDFNQQQDLTAGQLSIPFRHGPRPKRRTGPA